MVNALLYHCKNKLPVISGQQRPGIVHRLDKDTSGAIMVAKNDCMMQYLSGIIKERQIKKYYIAIVAGIIPNKKFMIESQIGRDPYNRIKMTVENPVNPKHSITHGEVIGHI
jgi:23S rRNA pseudouridine1911/1915/1917 synthase